MPLSLSLLLLPTHLMANNLKTEIDEHIVVTGTKTPKLLSNSPVSVEVISGDTIALISQGTLAQTLEFIPGVVITRNAKDGYNIQMQGFDSKHVLVLIDGQPLISPANGAVDLDQVSVNNIEQIEVIKGASSVLYGSSAMGGVINIITKREQDEQLSLTYQISSYLDNALKKRDGDQLSHLFKINASSTLFNWHHQVNLQVIQDAGFDYNANTVSHNAAALDKTFFNLQSYKAFEFTEARFKYQYFEESKKRASSSIPGQMGKLYYRSDVDQHQVDINLNNSDANWKVNTRYIKHQETSGQSNSLRESDIELAEIDGIKVWQHGSTNPKSAGQSGGEVVTGFVVHYDSLNQLKPATQSVEIDGKNRHSVELYSQYNFIKSSYQWLAGFRAQQDSDFGFHSALRTSGMLQLGNKSSQWQLRAGYGQGYRVPDLKERYYVFDHSNLGYMVLGNDKLNPEQSDSVNIGLSHQTTVFNGAANYSAELNTHYTETDNLITTVIDRAQSELTGLNISVYTNIASSKIYGFDLSNEIKFNHWYSQVNYSYIDSEDSQGKRLSTRPRHQIKFNLGVELPNYDVEALLYLVYQADEALPSGFVGYAKKDYTTINFNLKQQLTNQINWYLALDNIFNEHQSPDAVQAGLFDPRPVSSQELRLGLHYQF